jgi:hypothetical protein
MHALEQARMNTRPITTGLHGPGLRHCSHTAQVAAYWTPTRARESLLFTSARSWHR